MNELEEQRQTAMPMRDHLIRVGLTASEFPGDPGLTKEHFRCHRALHVADILDPALLATTLRLLERATWVDATTVASFRQNETPARAAHLLNLAWNRPQNLRWLEQVTGCGPLGFFNGLVARTASRPNDYVGWHDDEPQRGRRIAIVIHLSTTAFAGGEFEMRRKSGELLLTHRYTELNEALIFEVDPSLEHRVLPITAGGPRTVFAGWAFAEGNA